MGKKDGKQKKLTVVAEPISRQDFESGEHGAGDGQPFASIGRATGGPALAEALTAITRPDTAVGRAVQADGHVAVPLMETVFYGGYGLGLGAGRSALHPSHPSEEGASAAGGGGGGGGRQRVVAVIAVGPQGVSIRPVVDVTRLGIAALGASVALAGLILRRRR